ncbi:hypothetical protein like AT1G43760 [Hibiscus trionum]|uniref:Reverse transcriptase n=1 Tax=Hibiscus trionum TaxID=183268 RepID=A0A9W7ISV1_HIBTR|nr:hypothetical protein like AT1G43760 [Hibiscus trionum]
MWRQKSRINWLQQGDLNTNFFHRAVKIRAKRNAIHGANLGEKGAALPKALKQKVFYHFRKQFSCKNRNWDAIFNLEFSKISSKEAEELENPFTLEEIKEAIWSCENSKAPGSDGFNAFFFKNVGIY